MDNISISLLSITIALSLVNLTQCKIFLSAPMEKKLKIFSLPKILKIYLWEHCKLGLFFCELGLKRQT